VIKIKLSGRSLGSQLLLLPRLLRSVVLTARFCDPSQMKCDITTNGQSIGFEPSKTCDFNGPYHWSWITPNKFSDGCNRNTQQTFPPSQLCFPNLPESAWANIAFMVQIHSRVRRVSPNLDRSSTIELEYSTCITGPAPSSRSLVYRVTTLYTHGFPISLYSMPSVFNALKFFRRN
jgi:hypothetical protein